LTAVEQDMGRCVAHGAFVLEHDQLARRHLAARGGSVVFEHVDERVPQQLQIVVGEPVRSASLAETKPWARYRP
jgi:hypothetical protein